LFPLATSRFIITIIRFLRNQSKAGDAATAALWRLIGNGWGQHGDVVFFSRGAYRNNKNAVKTFQ
jgi:hypothetical protein